MELLNRKGTRGYGEHQSHRWEGERGEMAPPPQLSVVTQLLTAPPVCITKSGQGKQLPSGNLTQHLPHTAPQCLAVCDSLGTCPDVKMEESSAIQWLMGFLWALPTPLQVQMQKGSGERTLKSLTSATSQKGMKRLEKNGMVPQGFLGSCQFWWTLQSLHRQPCRSCTLAAWLSYESWPR